MKIVSFNINGIRARPHQIEAVVQRHQPNIIGLQETKVQDSEFPDEPLRALGYEVLFYGQKGHYGVALMYRDLKLISYKYGLPWDDEDAQRRVIEAEFQTGDGQRLTVFNIYFPNGEKRSHPLKFPYKEKFYRDLNRHLEEGHDKDSRLLVMGDMNVSPEDNDIGIGEKNRKRWLQSGLCSFLPEEREWYQQMMSWGLQDSFRMKHPEESSIFSWFDYRSRGFDQDPKRGLRIDHILLSKAAAERCTRADVDLEMRAMEKPSDHCPIWAELAVDKK